MMDFVPKRFSHQILDHVVLSLCDLPHHPLILGIFGPPGDGKSYQLRRVLERHQVSAFTMSAANLESDRAGQPGKDIQATYLKASRAIEGGEATAFVVDDIDTTVGEWENNTGTVNHQQVLAELMHLADRPSTIERIGVVRRVPVFVTGNDFGKLYPPLRRPGRMMPMHWQATIDERRQMLGAMLGPAHSNAAAALVRAYPDEPMAFFSQVAQLALRVLHRSTLVQLHARLPDIVANPNRHRSYLDLAGVRPGDYHRALEAAALDLSGRGSKMERSWLSREESGSGLHSNAESAPKMASVED